MYQHLYPADVQVCQHVVNACLMPYQPVLSAFAQGTPKSDGETPLRVLASYAKFSFAEADGRTAAVEAINAVAIAAAHCVPAIPLAGALSSSPGVFHCYMTPVHALQGDALSLSVRTTEITAGILIPNRPASRPMLPYSLCSTCSSSLSQLIFDSLSDICLMLDACAEHERTTRMLAGRQMDSDLQAALQEPFKPEAALADPDRAVAAAQLLCTAAEWHPSLLVALVYPTRLSLPSTATDGSSMPQTTCAPSTSDKEGSAEAGGQVLVRAGSRESARQRQRQPPAERQEGREDAFSALDGLWALLQRAEELRGDQPKLLAAVLSALVSLWQVMTCMHGHNAAFGV